jgi:alginate O-acetyltransferase complex protein AlgI
VLFPTAQFAIFFAIVLPLSWWLMRRQTVWKPFILLASYVFYATANPKFCLLLGGITLWNQGAAKLIHRSADEVRRKWITIVAVAGDLLTLGIFKYYAFFTQDIDRVLHSLGLGLPLPLVTIALPVGVSFFTFQAISYTVDVKRRLIEPASTIDAAIYLSFFPHLIAGPIVRAKEFLPQLAKPRDPNRVAASSGLMLIALGLVKKVVLADFIGRTIVDPVFAVPQGFGGPDVLLAAYGYAAQIYCDFSGYTDMAIGLALLMGYVFPQNFRSPYRATTLGDFWGRWHMTLSRFLRDFLYIPLGGNRRGKLFTYRNLMLTMVLGGLWHGAAWTFVIWGTLHGVGLVVEHVGRGRGIKLPGWLGWLITFNFVVVGWVFFRATSFSNATEFLSRLTVWRSPVDWSITALAAVVIVIGMQLLPPKPLEALQIWIGQLRPVVLGIAFAVLVPFVAATVPSQGVAPFIYFRF